MQDLDEWECSGKKKEKYGRVAERKKEKQKCETDLGKGRGKV